MDYNLVYNFYHKDNNWLPIFYTAIKLKVTAIIGLFQMSYVVVLKQWKCRKPSYF